MPITLGEFQVTEKLRKLLKKGADKITIIANKIPNFVKMQLKFIQYIYVSVDNKEKMNKSFIILEEKKNLIINL